MRIVTLLENSSCREDLPCEHGLSLYIEACGRRILFDAGQTSLFSRNAEKMGVDLSSVDAAILSHGHYDHSGGFLHFLKENKVAPVFVSPYAFAPHFNAQGRYIGIEAALAQSNRLVFVEAPTALAPCITLSPAASLPCPFPTDPWGLETQEHGRRIPEDFRHEQYLLLQEGNKRILFSGCSHKGILNIVDHFRPDILIGGFHLSKQTDTDELARTARQLLSYPTVYFTGHCTGQPQFHCMKKIMGDRLLPLSTGAELTVLENGDIILS